ncbi:hypothetical protein Droror1_Dr00025516 [Drosera rotundifolia]
MGLRPAPNLFLAHCLDVVDHSPRPVSGAGGPPRSWQHAHHPVSTWDVRECLPKQRAKHRCKQFCCKFKESSVDVVSEKEQGNEYFQQKKFNEAIDSYSRSIALSPSSVANANRAMAYVKIKRFQEAEDDCTEALNLDDRNIKAYSRQATARKELGKLRESLEDAELALRLEPQNVDVKK